MNSLRFINYASLTFCFIFLECKSKRTDQFANTQSGQQIMQVQNSSSCNIESAVLIGALYVASSPMKDQSIIQNVVNEYDYLLGENSSTIRCMRNLGNRLVQYGYQNFNFNANDENRIRGRVNNMTAGADIDGGRVADNVVNSMRQASLQPIVIGQELQWLAQVIPDAAGDDWYNYNNTGTALRQLAMQEAAQYKAIIELYGAFDPELQSVLGAVTPQMNQFIDNYGIWYIIACGVHLGIFQ